MPVNFMRASPGHLGATTRSLYGNRNQQIPVNSRSNELPRSKLRHFRLLSCYNAATRTEQNSPHVYYSRCYHLVLLNRLEVSTEPRARARGSAASLASIETLQPGHAFSWPDIDRLFDLDARHFLARLVEAQHGVVVHLEPLAVDLGFEHFRARNDIVPEDDLLAGSPELEDGQQFAAGHEVLLNGIVHTRAKHLPGIAARAVPRRNVEAVGLGAPLRIQRERHLLHPNGVVQGMPPILRPQAVVADAR